MKVAARRRQMASGDVRARVHGDRLGARLKRLAINAFLMFHLIAIAVWAVPFATPLTATWRNLVRPYLLWTGLFQSWDMFSPSPKPINSYVEAIVVYRDGDTRIWAFPRMERLGLKDRYFKERYRKFVENLKEDANQPLWPDAAKFIARLNNDRPVAEKMVLLVRYWSPIVPRADGAWKPEPWEGHVFYARWIAAGDLN
jgi:hypothetical protein